MQNSDFVVTPPSPIKTPTSLGQQTQLTTLTSSAGHLGARLNKLLTKHPVHLSARLLDSLLSPQPSSRRYDTSPPDLGKKILKGKSPPPFRNPLLVFSVLLLFIFISWVIRMHPQNISAFLPRANKLPWQRRSRGLRLGRDGVMPALEVFFWNLNGCWRDSTAFVARQNSTDLNVAWKWGGSKKGWVCLAQCLDQTYVWVCECVCTSKCASKIE